MTKQEELENRLKKFAISFVELMRELPKTESNRIYGNQGTRSTSSIGANYSEATCAHTTPDFLHDLNKCRKEAKESTYWLDLIFQTNKDYQNKILPVLTESREIFKIFMSSVKTVKDRMEREKKK